MLLLLLCAGENGESAKDETLPVYCSYLAPADQSDKDWAASDICLPSTQTSKAQ